jgi:hypothetical protein
MTLSVTTNVGGISCPWLTAIEAASHKQSMPDIRRHFSAAALLNTEISHSLTSHVAE